MRSIYPALTRRSFLSISALGVSAIGLAGCQSDMLSQGPKFPTGPARGPAPPPPPSFPDNATMYAAVQDGDFLVPAVPWQKIDQQFLRQVVENRTGQPEGTLVVDTASHHIYMNIPGGYSVRYGVGLGRAGFEWDGAGVIQWKQKWPKWTPPKEMIERDPKLKPWSAENGGMPGGLKNPLGARAHYIFQNGEDTLFRVHGTPEWSSIGKSVSSGCVRMMNQDVIDLYERVPNKTPIVVVNGLGAPIGRNRMPSSMPIDSGLPDDAYVVGRVDVRPVDDYYGAPTPIDDQYGASDSF